MTGALFFATAEAKPDPGPAMEQLIVTSIACSKEDASLPTASVRTWPWMPDLGSQPSRRRLHDGIDQFTFLVSSGHYFIETKSKTCSSMVGVSILPGHERHIVTRMWPLVAPDYYGTCAIAGTLPVEGLTVGLRLSSGRELPVRTEGGMYDVEGIGPGPETIVLHAGGAFDDISVTVPLYTNKGLQHCPNLVIRNIEFSDLREAGNK